MSPLCRVAVFALVLFAGAARGAEPGRCPQYLTLRSDNRGTSRELGGTTYAWGWFGAEPRNGGNHFPLYGYGWPTTHYGTTGDLWMWWYK